MGQADLLDENHAISTRHPKWIFKAELVMLTLKLIQSAFHG